MLFYRTFLWLSPVGVIYLVLKISDQTSEGHFQEYGGFCSREVSPYTSGFGPPGSFLYFKPAYPPPENQTI